MIARVRAAAARVFSRHPRSALIVAACSFAILILAILDNSGAFGYPGSDCRRFDQKAFKVARCVNGDTIVIIDDDKGAETTVHLLGVDAPRLPTDHWFEQSKKYTMARTANRTVTLRLEPIQSRNERGELLAYVFITDGDNLNADIIRDGQAYADRRVKHTFASQFSVAENEARMKPRGLWANPRDDQMPAWRREWLRSLKK